MRYVWEVTATGGAADLISKAIGQAIERLREGRAFTTELAAPELAVWREDILAAAVIDTASDGDGDKVSVLVEIETYGDWQKIAAVLSGGFDTEVLDAVMAFAAVHTCEHSDRIERIGS